jgi:molybdate transport system ATP-binding protein
VRNEDSVGRVSPLVVEEGQALEALEPRARSRARAGVEDLDVVGNHVRAHVTGELPIIAEVTPGAVASLRLDDGGPVFVAVKAMEVEVYEA